MPAAPTAAPLWPLSDPPPPWPPSACFLPPASPSALSCRKQLCGSLGPRSGAGATQRGHRCLVSTGDELESLRHSRVTCRAVPAGLRASSCAITSYSWTVLWAHCFDWQQSFWFPRAVQPRNADTGASGLWAWRDKGTGQPAHSWRLKSVGGAGPGGGGTARVADKGPGLSPDSQGLTSF